MRRLVIIHFNPIELYPPVMNLLNYFSSAGISFNVHVYTMSPPETMLPYLPASSHIRVIRKGRFTYGMNAAKRYFNYLLFYTSVFFHCIRSKPAIFLIYETLSFLPAYLYKKWISRKPALMIHYHEYMTRQEINNGMKLNKWLHRLEETSYRAAAWVSHTNSDRMQKFLSDHPDASIANPYILANYPSASWCKRRVSKDNNTIKVIYVGALSLDTMFTKEFAEWVLSQEGRVIWHIYSNNISAEVSDSVS